MAGVAADRVKETSTSTGTGNFTLAGAYTGFQSFNTAFGTASVDFIYQIEAIDASGTPTGDWEVGIGYLSDSTTLVRDIVLESSNSDAPVNFSAGSKNVFCAPSADRLNSARIAFDLQYGMP